MAEPTVCVKGLRAPFFAAAIATGAPMPELVARFELPPTMLADLGARAPHSLVARVWDELAILAGDEFFGLSAASLVGAPQLDLADLVLSRSPSLRALTVSFERYQRLFHEANDARFVEEGDEVIGRHRFSGELRRSRHFVEFILAMWVKRFGALIGPGRAGVRRVMFRHARPQGGGPYQAVFGVPVVFEAADDGLALPRALLDERLAPHDPAATRAFEAHLDAELAALGSASFPEQVRSLAVGLLRAGSGDSCEMGCIAQKLGLSRQTLQRRLADAGTSFRDVIDTARREVALAELSRGRSSMTDLAFLLGFSEHSAFCRAFRRWTGKSPALYARSATA